MRTDALDVEDQDFGVELDAGERVQRQGDDAELNFALLSRSHRQRALLRR